MLKRLTDIVISFVALLFLLPMFFVAGVLIKLDSPGPVFFRQVRIGRGSKPFRVYKLRTMVVNGGREGVYTTPEDDPRITRVGRVVRKYNLDELPQFINVLRGEMSIVGPRPEVPQYVAMFNEEEKAILTLRPGITDWATLKIRDKGRIVAGLDDPETLYIQFIRPEKLRLQLEYVKNRSLKLDFIIMLKTFKSHLIDRLFTKTTGMPEGWRDDKRRV